MVIKDQKAREILSGPGEPKGISSSLESWNWSLGPVTACEALEKLPYNSGPQFSGKQEELVLMSLVF